MKSVVHKKEDAIAAMHRRQALRLQKQAAAMGLPMFAVRLANARKLNLNASDSAFRYRHD